LCLAPARAAEPPKILVLGDSLVSGYGLARSDGFVAKLHAALKAKGVVAEVLDAGVSGDTTAGGRARLNFVLKTEPDFAIVELGANDALRALPPEEAERNLDAILTELKRRKIPALLAGMYAPPNLGRDYGQAFNGIYPRLAKKYGVALYPFFLEGIAGDAAFNLPDGLHPNAQGVDEIVKRILPSVMKLLGRG
jgi:acyl-CoA thioesterase I